MAEPGPWVEEEKEITSPENNKDNTSKQAYALAVMRTVYIRGSMLASDASRPNDT